MLNKILIANRGEIAVRIIRACHELNIKTVAIYSEVDRDAMHVRLANEAVCIGPAQPAKSYLNIPAIISAAEITGAAAIHPGYGFLAENANFAEQVEQSGFVFIGPTAKNIRDMGDKIAAIKIVREIGIPSIPGSNAPLLENNYENLALAKKIGYPVLIKAAAGGGGRGMAVVNKEKELINALATTRREAEAAFGNNTLYLEKYLLNPRHIEIQILGDGFGHAIHLGTRDCTIQRRHQKLLEEAPAYGIDEKSCSAIENLCVTAAKKIQYRGAGTFEFLYLNQQFYFIEMNTRIQVEHPVTEMVTGVDLVREQIMIASEKKLKLKQDDISWNGHAIECRINAEDATTFIPCPGKITNFHVPSGPGIRVDSHAYQNYLIPHHYDSLIAKVISHGNKREVAIARMRNALKEMVIDGIKTNIAWHQKTLASDEFARRA